MEMSCILIHQGVSISLFLEAQFNQTILQKRIGGFDKCFCTELSKILWKLPREIGKSNIEGNNNNNYIEDNSRYG